MNPPDKITISQWKIWTASTLLFVGLAVVTGLTVTQWLEAAREDSLPSGFENWVGVKAPDITMTTLDGKIIKLSDLKGQRVLLDFWQTYCPPCIVELPHLNQLRAETPTSQLAMFGLNPQEGETAINQFLQQHPVDFPMLFAPDLPAPYGNVAEIPTVFFIDRQGIIQSVARGYRKMSYLKRHALGSDYAGPLKPAPTP